MGGGGGVTECYRQCMGGRFVIHCIRSADRYLLLTNILSCAHAYNVYKYDDTNN